MRRRVRVSYCEIHEARHWIASTDLGLCYIGSPNQSEDVMYQWLNQKISNVLIEYDDKPFELFAFEIIAYMRGELSVFRTNIDPIGTEFQRRVWTALRTIPFGQTSTYSDIAKEIGRASAVRAVAAAIGANPILIINPCHRVIGKNGALTGFRAGLAMKEMLLRLEKKPPQYS